MASWDRKDTVQVCILHVETTTIAWSFGLRNLIIPGNLPPMGLTGLPFDDARNAAAMSVMDRGIEWCFFLDSDVVAPHDTIPRLIKHRQPIISGVYFRRSPPIGVPVMQKPAGQWITKYPPNSVIEVDVVGAGCLLIHRSVFEKLPAQRPEFGKHWFDWAVDCNNGTHPFPSSEDFTFNYHARKHGYKVLVDTSIKCRHIGYSESREGYYGPLENNPVT